ncbi:MULTISPECIES: hypothetical protein [Paenarthrobacter]|uniref:hypothetical protein n=1 Tax=Paenarthrobacter TaxID=1742992 RepID=UPI00187753CB|nr:MULTISPECIES: hypothetical protein [Paenarthrobacter]QOT18339.1 hypothetical protein HMI59_18195 [Paenarthrobacter sp. YJN-5]QQQ62833.1 hypothetical protein JHQ56_02970 [Paenarthrobacter ureafaciens]UOD81877.1 hypothetical protein MQZ73_03025 [Paenarthrobacter ureafaciens]WNZ05368.1 hypothetical protein PVT25_07565 [Paenarthrobacter ureafaciens]
MITQSQKLKFAGALMGVVGVAVAVALWTASFSRYSRIEDLGLDVDPSIDPEILRKLTAFTVHEQVMFYGGLSLAIAGLILLIMGSIKSSRAKQNR